MTNVLDKYDLVKVKQAHDKDTEEFVGSLGIVIDFNENHEYLYEVLFVGKKLNEKSKELGVVLWKKYQLEAV